MNGNPFFITVSRKLDFTAVSHLTDRKIPTIVWGFKSVYSFYAQRGFIITIVSADGEFGPLQEKINDMPHGPQMNLASADEHVPEVERRIWVVKERARDIQHNLPFHRIPKILLINMVLLAVEMLTYFPTKAGISKTLSPRAILTGESLDYKKHLSLQFGQYCQVHQENAPTNSQKARTKGAICMGPSGNRQGGYKFMSIWLTKKITGRVWDVIPMPDIVIDRVNELG